MVLILNREHESCVCVSNSARQLDEYIRARQWTKSTASGIPLVIQCLLSEITWIFGNLKSQSSATSSWLSTGLTRTRLSIKMISTFLKKKKHVCNTRLFTLTSDLCELTCHITVFCHQGADTNQTHHLLELLWLAADTCLIMHPADV